MKLTCKDLLFLLERKTNSLPRSVSPNSNYVDEERLEDYIEHLTSSLERIKEIKTALDEADKSQFYIRKG